MGTKKSKIDITKDATVDQAYQKYKLLKQEVVHWQQERGPHWIKTLSLAEKPPYLPIRDLPSEAIVELWQRLNSVAGTTIPVSELMEIQDQFMKDRGLMDAEMAACFQMAVSGVAQLAGRMANEKGVPSQSLGYTTSDDSHGSIVCPVCDETVALAVLTPPNGQRMMHCSSCGFEWPVKRVRCLICESVDSKQQVYLKNEAFPGIEMVVCQDCGHSFKEIDARQLSAQDYMWEDLRTLPLNFAAEQWLAENMKKSNRVH